MKARVIGFIIFLLITVFVISILNSLEEVANFWIKAWYIVFPLCLLWFLEPIATWLDEFNNFLKD